MRLAIAIVHHRFGFFMDWAGTQKGEGLEFNLLALATTVFLIIRGGGAASADRQWSSPAKNSIRARYGPQACFLLSLTILLPITEFIRMGGPLNPPLA
jgi:hypothetical protein